MPPEKREEFLEHAYPEDPRIRDEVQSLLRSAPVANSFLEDSPISSVSESPFALAPGQRLGNFEILEAIGRGGMGEVYRARDLRLKREVAIKVLTSGGTASERRRFLYEAQAASALNHPNIVTVHDVGESDGVSYIAMEFIAGKTLNALIPLEGMAVPDRVGNCGADRRSAGRGARGGHRPPRPQARQCDGHRTRTRQDTGLRTGQAERNYRRARGRVTRTLEPKTDPGTILGTVGYMSPEQAEGKQVDARSDIFSFGAVLYEMLTGKRAFGRGSTASTLAAILKEDPQPLRELVSIVPLELERVVQRCLCKDPSLRFQTAADLKSALENPELVTALPARKPGVRSSGKRRKALAASSILILLLGLGGVTWWQWSHRRILTGERKQRQLTTNSSENPIVDNAISPDGKYLAYTDVRGLHIKRAGTSEVRDIPNPDSRARNTDWRIGGWFPDSTRFAATTNPRDQPPAGWAVSILSGAAKKLYDGFGTGPVSPDGTTIAYIPRGSSREIWLVNADGQQARKAFETDKSSHFSAIAWSPDSQRLAYIRVHAGYARHCDGIATPSGCMDDVSMESWDRRTGLSTTILSNARLKGLADLAEWMYSLVWLSDGRIVYPSAETGRLNELAKTLPDFKGRGCNLWEVRLDARTGSAKGEPQPLTNWGGFGVIVSGATADGRQLVYARATDELSLYVADFDASKIRLDKPRRLTDQQATEFPTAWTADSKAVVFGSDRSGGWEIFKQRLDSGAAETVATGLQSVFYLTPLTPDGSWLLNVSTPREPSGAPGREITRIPIAGGVPIPVMTDRNLSVQCANAPAQLCVLEQPTTDGKYDIYSAFDPITGRGRELARAAFGVRGFEWALSPDGTNIANLLGGDSIHLIYLNGLPDRTIHVKNVRHLRNINWAADGKGFFFAYQTEQQQSQVLVHVDLDGNARAVWEVKGPNVYLSGLPSPDGRHLAIWVHVSDCNVWTLENF